MIWRCSPCDRPRHRTSWWGYAVLLLLIWPLVGLAGLDSTDSPRAGFVDSGTFLVDLPASGPLNTSADVQQWLDAELKHVLGLEARDHLELEPGRADAAGFVYYRTQQLHAGHPVIGNDGVVAIDSAGIPGVFLGRHAALGDVLVEAGIDHEEARRRSGVLPLTEDAPALVYWPGEDRFHLAWKFAGSRVEGEEMSRLYVDAGTGEFLGSLPLVFHTRDRHVHDMSAACSAQRVTGLMTPGGSRLFIQLEVQRPEYTRSEHDRPTGRAHVDRMHDLMGDLYTFIEAEFGMSSIDDNGMPLRAVAGARFSHLPNVTWPQCVGDGFNAQWHPAINTMVVPESVLSHGLVEVVAHELGHGIVSNGSRLNNSAQAGALNESVSDLVGVAFRAWRQAGGRMDRPIAQGFDSTREVWGLRYTDGLIRDMANPRNADPGYPDHFSGFLAPTEGNNRAHANANILNHAWFLMAEGGQHRRLRSGPAVEAIGLRKTAQIAAHAASLTMSSATSYYTVRNALAQSAENLFGEHSREWQTVHEALDAVGIPGNWRRPPVIESPPVPEPEPAPAPEPPPVPEPPVVPEPPPVEEVPEIADETPDQPLLFALLALLVAAALGAVILSRPRHPDARPSAPRFVAQGEQPARRDETNVPAAAASSHGLAEPTWSLRAMDGSESIPLHGDLLRSGEGVVIGRAPELAHVCMQSRQVSRRHLRLFERNGQLRFEDLYSSHGTQLDGHTVPPFSPEPLNEGQILGLAGFSYQLVRSRAPQ
ncbi:MULTISPECIES: M4 family metallopeptidase [unclassified Thioalkalivibrio]|uniref:M4 family metallopeptidase n=1 Tax=unclassified Thioalkalivibrio TaxID=2621013 RepID=UPI00039D9833|nr:MULTISPECIES: M4 family metallopeptidase [unclassified Thioalkalivibrio]